MSAGEQRAFDEFFRANAPRLVAFITRHSGLDPASVEDIVQNALVKAMRSLNSYRGEASLFTWLTQICLYELLDTRRKAARQPTHMSFDDLEDVWRRVSQMSIPASQEPAAEVDAQLNRAAVIHTLQSLPQRYAQVLEAKYGDGLSVDEIAAMMGVTNIAVQSLLARAREAFRTQWQARAEEPLQGSAPL